MNRLLRLLFFPSCVVAALASSGCGAASAGAIAPSSVVRNTGVEVPVALNAARVAAVLAQPGRRVEDRALDDRRQAAEILSYLDVSPGMDVAVLAPGAGYFLELVARSVGLDGRVFARNPPSLVAASGLGQAWDERLARPAGARVVRIDDDLGKPLAVHGLDLVFLDHDYAELGAHGVQPSAVNAATWNALREGGRFVAVERETEAAKTRQAIESHGFRLESEGRFLRNGTDPCDWTGADRAEEPAAGAEKRILLTFVKPQG